MADTINSISNKQSVNVNQKQVENTNTNSAGNATSSGSPQVNTFSDDQVVLTEVGKKISEDPGFDPVKVEAIKQAISEGNYPLDSRKIAESYASLEKLIGPKN